MLYYQPKIHLRSGLVTRVEALVRWRHPERGLMQPDQFIPLAEDSDINILRLILRVARDILDDMESGEFPHVPQAD